MNKLNYFFIILMGTINVVIDAHPIGMPTLVTGSFINILTEILYQIDPLRKFLINNENFLIEDKTQENFYNALRNIFLELDKQEPFLGNTEKIDKLRKLYTASENLCTNNPDQKTREECISDPHQLFGFFDKISSIFNNFPQHIKKGFFPQHFEIQNNKKTPINSMFLQVPIYMKIEENIEIIKNFLPSLQSHEEYQPADAGKIIVRQENAPQFLIFYINRFEETHKFYEELIEVPFTINIRDRLEKPAEFNEKQSLYQLHGILNYNATKKFYFAFVKDFQDNGWYSWYGDTVFSETDLKTMISMINKQAFILVYKQEEYAEQPSVNILQQKLSNLEHQLKNLTKSINALK